MYYNPERFKEQGYSGFSACENWHVGSVIVGITHQMTGCSSPDFFQAVHVSVFRVC